MSDEPEQVQTEEPQETESPPDQLPADHPLVKALAAQKAEIRDLKGKARRLDEIEEASKSEAQKLADRLTAEAAAREAAEAALMRYEVASEVGVPANAMKFLTGTTRDEVAASAKEVMELIGEAGKPRAPKPDPNQGRTSPEATTPASQFASFLQQQLNNT